MRTDKHLRAVVTKRFDIALPHFVMLKDDALASGALQELIDKYSAVFEFNTTTLAFERGRMRRFHLMLNN